MVETIKLMDKHNIEIPSLDRSKSTLARITFLALKDKEIKPKTFRDKAEEIFWYLRDTWIAEFGIYISDRIKLLEHKDTIMTDIEEVSKSYAQSVELFEDEEADNQTLGFCAAIIALTYSNQEESFEKASSWTDEEIVNYVARMRQQEQSKVALEALNPKTVERAARKGQLSLF